MSFHRWLMKQGWRSDRVGHFAREIERLQWRAPGNAGILAWHRFLWDRDPRAEVSDLLHIAWREYAHDILPDDVDHLLLEEREQERGAQDV